MSCPAAADAPARVLLRQAAAGGANRAAAGCWYLHGPPFYSSRRFREGRQHDPARPGVPAAGASGVRLAERRARP